MNIRQIIKIFQFLILSLICFSCASTKVHDTQDAMIFKGNEQLTTNPILVPTTEQIPEVKITQELPGKVTSSVCPSDMAHVVGDYCPGLSHTCLKWKDKDWCRKHDPKDPKKCIELVKAVACAEFKIPGKCLSKPNEIKKLDFCMDIYEGGVKKGEIPPYMKSWLDGKQECEAKGKRLCTDIEWTKACEGPENFPYPYGYKRDANACNIDHPQIPNFDASKVFKWTPELLQKLDKRVPAGSMPLCVSSYGIHDMTGNVDEATVNVSGGGKPYKNYLKGGHWVAGARNRCTPATESHNVDFVNYESSYRCCKDI